MTLEAIPFTQVIQSGGSTVAGVVAAVVVEGPVRWGRC